MTSLPRLLATAATLTLATAATATAQEITIATVNNGDMIRMQGLTSSSRPRTRTSP
jgi:sorbitol/mannitol transport system substrate-binding protein